MSAADSMYGLMSRRKLVPVASMAMISELPASFEVKNMTAMKTKSGEKRLEK